MLNCILSDEGQIIDDSINNLAQSSLIALVVVVVVILVYGRMAYFAFVALSIPISISACFAAMFATGLTLNIFTISALALAIGLLVDNAIVVSESIARKLEDGLSKHEAALTGTNEVIGPLLGSTLTTLGVFIPITLLTGIQGAIFKEFALTPVLPLEFFYCFYTCTGDLCIATGCDNSEKVAYFFGHS